jgi:hypothetical protein
MSRLDDYAIANKNGIVVIELSELKELMSELWVSAMTEAHVKDKNEEDTFDKFVAEL